jgi:dTMP kinase
MAQYIVFEGTEGVGKTTQVQKLTDYLREQGYSVLQTKEPGTSHSPLTMQLRGIMLDNQYDEELTQNARELVSQAIRSIHLEKVIRPALTKYDFIIQDRGILSGLAYGEACGNDVDWLVALADQVSAPLTTHYNGFYDELYTKTVYLDGNVSKGLDAALGAKKEFEAGDAMESRGESFLESVKMKMDTYSSNFNTTKIFVDGKNIEEVFTEILNSIEGEIGAIRGKSN